MTEHNQNPYQPVQNPYQPQATNPMPNAGRYGTEFGAEQTPQANAYETEFANEQDPLNNATNQAEHKSAKEMEKKDAKGKDNNTNPFGDKAKKSKKDEMEKKSADPHLADEARQHAGQPNNGEGIGYTNDVGLDQSGGNK